MAIIERRLGRLATRAVASVEKRGFRSKLATCGGGHIHVPDTAESPAPASLRAAVAPVMAIVKRRLGRPATRAVASVEKRGFRSPLATCGGGHIHVPDAGRFAFAATWLRSTVAL
jgi:hypothetical protein